MHSETARVAAACASGVVAAQVAEGKPLDLTPVRAVDWAIAIEAEVAARAAEQQIPLTRTIPLGMSVEEAVAHMLEPLRDMLEKQNVAHLEVRMPARGNEEMAIVIVRWCCAAPKG